MTIQISMIAESPFYFLQYYPTSTEISNNAVVECEQYPYQNRRRIRNDCNDDNDNNDHSYLSKDTPKIRTNNRIIHKPSICYHSRVNVNFIVVVAVLLVSIAGIAPTFAQVVEKSSTGSNSNIRIRIGSYHGQHVQQQHQHHLPVNKKYNYNIETFHEHNIHQRLLNGHQQRISKGMTASSSLETTKYNHPNERKLVGGQQQQDGKTPKDGTTATKTTNTKGKDKDASSETAPASSPSVLNLIKNSQKGVRGGNGGGSNTGKVKDTATDNTKTKGGGTTKQQQDSATVIPLATFTIELETRGGNDIDSTNDENNKDGKKKGKEDGNDFDKEQMTAIEMIVANYLHTAMKLPTKDVVTIQGSIVNTSKKDDQKKGKNKDDASTDIATTTTSSSRIFQFDGTVTSSNADSQNVPLSIQKSILWRRQNTALTDAYHELELALVGYLQGTSTTSSTTSSASSSSTNTTTTIGDDSINNVNSTNTSSSSTIHIVDVDMSKLVGTSPQYYAEDDEDDDDTNSDSSSSSNYGATGSSPSNPKNSLQLENIHSTNHAETQGTFVVVLVVANVLFAMIIGCFWRFTKQPSKKSEQNNGNDNGNTDEEDILVITKPEPPVVPSHDDIRTFYIQTMFQRKQKSSAISPHKIPTTISTKNKGTKKSKKRTTVHPLPTIASGTTTTGQQLQLLHVPHEGDVMVIPVTTGSSSNNEVTIDHERLLDEDTTESSSSSSSTRSTKSSGDVHANKNNNNCSIDPVLDNQAPVSTVTASVRDNTDNNDMDHSLPIVLRSSSSVMSFREQMAVSLSMLTPSEDDDDEDEDIDEDHINECSTNNDEFQNLYDCHENVNEPGTTTAMATSMQENDHYLTNPDINHYDDAVIVRFHEDGINYNSQEYYSWTNQSGSNDDSAITTSP